MKFRIGTDRLFRNVAALCVSAGLVGFLISRMSFETLLSIIGNLSPSLLAGAFGVYLLLNVARTFRSRLLFFGQSIPFLQLFCVTFIHNTLAQTLPFRSGEVSFPILVRRYGEVPLAQGTGALILARLVELLFVVAGGLFGVVSASGFLELQIGNRLTNGLIMGLVVLIVLGLIAIYRADVLIGWGAGIFSWAARNVMRSRTDRLDGILSMFKGKIEDVARHTGNIREPKLFLLASLWSFLTYALGVSFSLVLIKGVGIDAEIPPLIAAVSLSMIAGWIPLSVSGFGTVEGGWVIGFIILIGMDMNSATSLAFALHGAQLAAVLASGLLGLLLLFPFARGSSRLSSE